jgi:hypothetical protein
LRNPPGVAKQHNAFFNECLPAHPVGYGTNGVPNPPYIDCGAAQVSAIQAKGEYCCNSNGIHGKTRKKFLRGVNAVP